MNLKTAIWIFLLFLNFAQAQIPELSQYGSEAKRSMELACSTDKVMNGPSAYANCLNRQIAQYTTSIGQNGTPSRPPSNLTMNNSSDLRHGQQVGAVTIPSPELESGGRESRLRDQERLATQLQAERARREELEERLSIAQQQRPLMAPLQQTLSAHALVIGNAAYPGSGRLDNPINDSRAISAKLRSLGFKVTEVEDANRAKLVTALGQFSRSAVSADLSVLFYSGHGVQMLGTNYILPTDIDQSDLAQATIQGISLDSVIGQFLPGKTKLVFLDACRDNPLYQAAANKSFNKGLAPISVAEGTLIAYATKDGQVASDGGKGTKNSPFTVALLEHLSDPDDIAVVLRRVREKVKTATGGKQVPWDYGSLTGGALVLSAIKPPESKK